MIKKNNLTYRLQVSVKHFITFALPPLFLLFFFTFSFTSDSFQHQSTGFLLSGAHADLSCINCHPRATRDEFQGLRSECVTCHLVDYNSTDHINRIYLITDCSRCHDSQSWDNHHFVHDNSDTQCSICHLSDGNSANQLVTGHVQLANKCTICHSAQAWNSIQYEHLQTDRTVGIPADADCSACHQSGFTNMEVDNE